VIVSLYISKLMDSASAQLPASSLGMYSEVLVCSSRSKALPRLYTPKFK